MVVEIGAGTGTLTRALAATGASVRAYEVENPIEFMTRRPGLAIHAARLLAQRLHDGTTYLADLKVQFEDRKDHLGMVDQVLDALMHHQRKVAGSRETRSDDPRL